MKNILCKNIDPSISISNTLFYKIKFEKFQKKVIKSNPLLSISNTRFFYKKYFSMKYFLEIEKNDIPKTKGHFLFLFHAKRMSIQIIEILPSHRKNKKFKAILNNGTEVHFGLKNSNTFIDNASLQTRNAYLARHLANKIEKQLIENIVMSPSLLLHIFYGIQMILRKMY